MKDRDKQIWGPAARETTLGDEEGGGAARARVVGIGRYYH